MKTRIRLAATLALVALCTPSPVPAQPSEWPFRVVTVGGGAEVYRKSASAWSAATLSADLQPGDAARTIVGRLTLRTASGQTLRFASLTRVSLLNAGAPDQSPRVNVDGGSVWVAVMPGSPPREQIEVQAGPVAVTVRGGGAWIALNPDGSALVRAYHGTAECAGPGSARQWKRALTGGQELSVSSAGGPGESRQLTRDKVDAAWVKWNEDQDLAGGYGGTPPAR